MSINKISNNSDKKKKSNISYDYKQEDYTKIQPILTNGDESSDSEVYEDITEEKPKFGINLSLDIPISKSDTNEKNLEVDIDELVPETSNDSVIVGINPIYQYEPNLDKYSQFIRSKGKASANVKDTNGKITTGNQSYIIVPDHQYEGHKDTISESDYNLLITVIAGEGGNDVDDMLGVASTIFNRYEDEIRGSSFQEVLHNGYFKFGESYKRYIPGGKFYDTPSGQEKLANAKEVLDDVMCGVRNMNHNVYYYYGDGEHNYFSDVV